MSTSVAAPAASGNIAAAATAIGRPSKRRAHSPIDTERETREIELLEKKLKMLREYKTLVQEIRELEAGSIGFDVATTI